MAMQAPNAKQSRDVKHMIITAALYSREKFKGTGTPDFFCTPHLVNVMLLARDTNGRRIYNSKADLAAALNINEQMCIRDRASVYFTG